MAMINIKIGDIQLQRKAKFSVSIDGVEILCISAHHVAEVVRQHYGGASILSPCDVYNACSSCPRRGKSRLTQRRPADLNIIKLSDHTSFGVDRAPHANQRSDDFEGIIG